MDITDWPSLWIGDKGRGEENRQKPNIRVAHHKIATNPASGLPGDDATQTDNEALTGWAISWRKRDMAESW